MAARNFPSNRIYNQHIFPVQLDAQITIGASGAPTLVTSSTVPLSNPSVTQRQSQGIYAITRLSTGRYQLQLKDNYSSLLAFDAMFTAPVTGSDIPVDATTAGLSSGTVYQITDVGTATTAANWATLGLPIGITAAVGQIFKAATTGTGIQSGAGTVKAIGVQAVNAAQLLGLGPDKMLNAQPFNGTSGGFVNFQTMAQAFTAGAYTPAGTNSAPAFTGSALATHAHNLLIKGGQASATTNDLAHYATDILGKEAATDATILGVDSATKGGVLAITAGTPAGTVAAPTFTGAAATLTGTIANAVADPSQNSTMYLRLLLSNSALQ